MAVPLLLDTDVGDDVDDVFALLLAAGEPALSLLGVTTVYGDTAQRARIARKLLGLAGQEGVPVVAGLGRTLEGRDPGPMIRSGEGFVDGPGSAEWTALGAGLLERPAPEFLVETILGAPEPPVLAAIGPLTNLGAALRRAPEVARKVRALVLMGGRLEDESALGEHNVNSDPEATRIVLESGAPLRIGTYEVTREARLGATDLPRLRAGPPACQAAAGQLALYLEQMGRSATSMYDPLSLTAAYTDRYLTLRPAAVRVTAGVQLAVLWEEPGAPPNAEVSVGLDAPAFIAYLLGVLSAGC
jgi:purine nucleosidase